MSERTLKTAQRYVSGAQLLATPQWYEADAAWKAKQVRRILKNQGLNPRTVCDVGCGTGGVLDHLGAALPQARRLVGYELSPQALGLASEERRGRLELIRGDILEDSRRFDLLLLLDVFEHVEDYLGFLRSLQNRADYYVFHIPLELSVQAVLRPRSFGDARAVLGHLHYFSRETALATLADAGYEVLREEFTAPRIDQPAPSIRALMAKVPRRVVFRLAPAAAARLLGGFELMVLARCKEAESQPSFEEAVADSSREVTLEPPQG